MTVLVVGGWYAGLVLGCPEECGTRQTSRPIRACTKSPCTCTNVCAGGISSSRTPSLHH